MLKSLQPQMHPMSKQEGLVCAEKNKEQRSELAAAGILINYDILVLLNIL